MKGRRANVKYMDTGTVAEIDVSMIDASKDSYVEIFADHAITRISRQEAVSKRNLMRKLLKAAMEAE